MKSEILLFILSASQIDDYSKKQSGFFCCRSSDMIVLDNRQLIVLRKADKIHQLRIRWSINHQSLLESFFYFLFFLFWKIKIKIFWGFFLIFPDMIFFELNRESRYRKIKKIQTRKTTHRFPLDLRHSPYDTTCKDLTFLTVRRVFFILNSFFVLMIDWSIELSWCIWNSGTYKNNFAK